MRTRVRSLSMIAAGIVALSVLPGGAVASADPQQFLDVGRESVPRAECGPGSLPETGLQGDVPAEDRDSGRSRDGYRCNATLVGQYAGHGGGITSTTFDHCSYTASFFPGNLLPGDGGVHVVDASDPANPVLSTVLTEPAMLGGTWETLKVNKERKLLAGTAVPVGLGAAYFSVYDISDCAHPKLLNPGPGTDLTMPLPFTSHEGGFSPDGNTYWASGVAPGFLSAIDISDPSNPHIVWQGLTGIEEHGFGISPDGNRLYLSALAGITVLDVSAVQRRDPHPHVPHIGRAFWTDGQLTQHSIPVTYDGKPYIFTADEAGSGGVKLIDVSDEENLEIVERIKLEINLPENMEENFRSAQGGSVFAYDSHYCAADRPTDPTALACGWISSGIRVFDVEDPHDIREIAYYNPPARTGENLQLTNSPHALASIIGIPALSFLSLGRAVIEDGQNLANSIGPRSLQVAFGDLSSDWCFSPPEWHGSQLWTTCSDNGFMVIQLDNDVYTPPPNQNSTVGS
ncbi:LVIVD repeat-containing protein [Rhodococcus triatomae]|uniref:LVIVD repeat-containing protein n=2 Tax=Rhodococcus triatomae TaxID=300028 RepID=A0A1G8F346_9NOCA|nr:LVIVD repeat-containing protein [Rhodococcus triatomae]